MSSGFSSGIKMTCDRQPCFCALSLEICFHSKLFGPFDLRPFSRLISLLGLQNSTWSLVLVYPTFTVPFCTWLLMGFFKSLPKEVEESAMVDGCGRK